MKFFRVVSCFSLFENILAIEIINKTDDKSCGLIFLGEIEFADGSKQRIASNEKVKAIKDMPTGDWKELNFDDTAWTAAIEMGDASTGRWMKMGDPIRFFTTDEEKKAYYAGLEAAKHISPELAAIIAAEPEPKAQISWKNGLPMIQVNEQTELLPIRRIGLSTVAPYDGYDFVCKSRGFGLDILEIGVNDYFDSQSFWKAEGTYDFSELDLPAAKLLSINPNARFIVNVGLNVMRQWCKNHPDETVGYAAGPVNPGDNEGDELGGRPLRPSPASRLFRQEIDRIISALAAHIQSKPWVKRVIGVKISYGVTAEWEYYGSIKQMPDCGVAMSKAFREFLTQKYGSDEELKKAWNNPDASIAKAMPPTPDERWGDRHYLRDPNKYRFVTDFYDCMHQEMADLMIFCGRTTKKYLPGRLFGCYYSYQNMPRSPEGAKTMEEPILASGAVDFFCAPNDYNNETRSGGGTGMTRIRTSILQRFGKLGILEADIRTYIAECCEPVLRLKSPEESIAVIRRDFCNTIFDRGSLQLHQFGGNGPYRGGPDWYNAPELLEEIRKGMDVQRQVRQISGMRWEQDIAVVSSYGEFAHHGYPVQDLLMNDYVVWMQIYGLYCSGYVFDYMDMKDFMLSSHPYKIVVFLAPYTFTDVQRAAMRNKLRNSGVTAIWIYAPGLATERGFSDEAMQELTGIKLQSYFRKLPMSVSFNGNDSIAVTDPWHDNRIHQESPRIHSTDPEATVNGTYPDGSAGFVEKMVDGFKSVFIGVPVKSPWHWASLFSNYGGNKMADPMVIVRANSDLVMVHVGEGGAYKINLPVKAKKVLDVYNSNRIVGENCSQLELITDVPYTWLLQLEK